MIIFKIIILILLLEVFIQVLIRSYKKKFKWFINDDDELPKFNKTKLKNFLLKNFDQELGWRQKLDSSGFLEKINKSDKSKDYRKLTYEKKKKLVAAFGDSYVFSNYMSDRNTWEEQISKKNQFNILNYGVSNYGLDQAILKYKRCKVSKNVKIVIMGFVPETITRIQSRWKHYTEFGNINGFKPKFDLVNNKLVLKPNPINKKITPLQLNKIILKLRNKERFYNDRFLKYKFRFPYIINFFKNFEFNIKIITLLVTKDLIKIFKNYKIYEILESAIFYSIIERNVKEAHILYQEEYSKKLITNLLKEFEKTAVKKKHIPLIIIFPQPQDINLKSSKFYKVFFNKFSNTKKILDLSDHFTKKNYKKYFLIDKYGGHLNRNGNIFVAKIINKHLNILLKKK